MIAEIAKTTIYLGSFVIVIFLAYFFSKYIAKKSNLLSKSKNIKVLEAISLGNNTRIFIIEIIDIVYIVFDNNSQPLLLEKFSKKEVDILIKDSETGKDNLVNITEKLLQQKKEILYKLGNKKWK